MINYNSISNRTENVFTPWTALKWSVSIVFIFFTALALIALATINSPHRDNVIAIFGGIVYMLFLLSVILAFKRAFDTFRKQKVKLNQFAQDNNWVFDVSKRQIGDLMGHPPTFVDFPGLTKVRCTITGEFENTQFLIAFINYWQYTGAFNTLLTSSRHRPAWLTFIRFPGNISIKKSEKYYIEYDEIYTYVTMYSNALYADDVQCLIECVEPDLQSAPAYTNPRSKVVNQLR